MLRSKEENFVKEIHQFYGFDFKKKASWHGEGMILKIISLLPLCIMRTKYDHNLPVVLDKSDLGDFIIICW